VSGLAPVSGRMGSMEHLDAQLTSAAAGLGEPIGLGRTAEVFARGEDEVVKLLRRGFPDLLGESEAEVAALVADAGVAAPRFMGTVRIDGRLGLIYERLVGPSMLDHVSQRPWAIDRQATRFAELHAAMHQADGSGLPDQRRSLRWMIDRAGEHLPDEARRAALSRLEALPDGDAICHGDMHPGNVLLAARGAVVIDWLTACRGRPECDVARTLFLLRDSGLPTYMPRLRRSLIALARRRFSSVYVHRYRRLRSLDEREVAAWRLPLLAARLGEEIEVERASLQALIQRELEPASR
jgi:aminoglycoside phosphotransferase (APT) family kinase protein